jgi:hypothetical protein
VTAGRRQDAGGAALLAEVPEAGASGLVAEIYDDIRSVFGVSFVVFVYRALAVDAGRLAAVWEAVRPNLLSDEAHRLARRLGAATLDAVEPLPDAVLASSRLDRRLVANTLTAFHRVNTRNAIVLPAIRDGHDGLAPPPRAAAPPRAALPILPMADFEALPSTARELLRTMSGPITGGVEPVVIPSLLRYFAPDERLLGALWAALEPILTAETYARSIVAMQRRADEASRALPYSVARCDDADAHQIVSRFLRAIPAMAVTAPTLARTLGVDIDATCE